MSSEKVSEIGVRELKGILNVYSDEISLTFSVCVRAKSAC